MYYADGKPVNLTPKEYRFSILLSLSIAQSYYFMEEENYELREVHVGSMNFLDFKICRYTVFNKLGFARNILTKHQSRCKNDLCKRFGWGNEVINFDFYLRRKKSDLMLK